MSRTLSSAAADAPRVAVQSAVTPEDLAEYVPYAIAAGVPCRVLKMRDGAPTELVR
jgi:acetyltransferase-like isoleucine patch superfamily enzyme